MTPLFSLDFTEEDESNAIPAGTYRLKIDTSNTVIRKSQAENDVFDVTFIVDEGEYVGTAITDVFVMTDNAKWKIKALTKALGLVPPGAKKVQTNTKEWHGKRVMGKVTQDTYQGVTRNKVSGFHAV